LHDGVIGVGIDPADQCPDQYQPVKDGQDDLQYIGCRDQEIGQNEHFCASSGFSGMVLPLKVLRASFAVMFILLPGGYFGKKEKMGGSGRNAQPPNNNGYIKLFNCSKFSHPSNPPWKIFEVKH
jgi:hypothetical protein